jgi:hypothetical protein
MRTRHALGRAGRCPRGRRATAGGRRACPRGSVGRDVHTRAVSEGLAIPPRLSSLIETGVWPTTESAHSQQLRPSAAAEDVGRLAPGEDSLFLDPPPFRTLASVIAENRQFWDEHGALDEIDPELALVIGDFGLGSDAAIVLDYRRRRDEPSVLRLAWTADGNHWVEAAPTFEEFARLLRLG